MSNIFIKFAGIEGQTTAKGYEKWSLVGCLAFDAERDINTQPGKTANRASRPLNFSRINLTKLTDSATSMLLHYVFGAGTINQVDIHVCQSGAELKPYEIYQLHNVMLADYHKFTAANAQPVELIRLDFNKIELLFLGYDSKNSARAPSRMSYDLATVEIL